MMRICAAREGTNLVLHVSGELAFSNVKRSDRPAVQRMLVRARVEKWLPFVD
jgi:hypothetical protein